MSSKLNGVLNSLKNLWYKKLDQRGPGRNNSNFIHKIKNVLTASGKQPPVSLGIGKSGEKVRHQCPAAVSIMR